MIEGIPMKGSFSRLSLPKILIGLNRARATGTLSVTSGGFTKKVFLDKGDAIFASSTYEDDRLGEMLLKAGKITVEQYDKSVEMLKKTAMRQGAILVKLGYLTPKDLFWGVKFQVRQIIFSLFQLEDGDYEFTEGETPTGEVITLNMSMGNLIYEGVKRIENWTRIRREMPDMEGVLQLSSDPLSLFQEVELSPQDKKILSLVDGSKTIKSLIEQSWLNSFEAMKTLYLLWSVGILTEKKMSDEASISLEELLKPLTDEEEEFMSRVNDTYKQLPQMTSYQILELNESADMEEIKKNYYRLAKEFHPDRHFGASSDALKDKLNAIFAAINDANRVLSSPVEKARYDGTLSVAPPKPRTDHREAARAKFQEGKSALGKGLYEDAAVLFGQAVYLDKSVASYHFCLGTAYAKQNKYHEAVAAINAALEIEPRNADYIAELGHLFLRLGFKSRARSILEKAIRLDPSNKRALDGLAAVQFA